MMFVNMLKDCNRYQKRGASLPIDLGECDTTSSDIVHLVDNAMNWMGVSGKSIEVSSADESGNLFALRGNPDEQPIELKGIQPLTYKDLADTEENPLLVIATTGIRFYYDIPTYIKVLFVNDEILVAMLVYGACDFRLADGSYVPLARCTDANMKEAHSDMTPKDLKALVFDKTSVIGYDKSMDMICPLLVRATKQRVRRNGKVDVGGNIAVRLIKGRAYIFNQEKIDSVLQEETEVLERQRKRKEETELAKQVRKEEALKRQDEFDRKLQSSLEELHKKNEVYAEKKRQLHLQDLERRRAAKRALNPRNDTKVRQTNKDKSGRNSGAQAFLAMLNK